MQNTASITNSRARHKIAIVAAMLGGIALTVGAVAQNGATGGFHHGHHGVQAANASPADVAAHIDQVLQHIYAETGATSAQQAQIAPLVQATAADLTRFSNSATRGRCSRVQSAWAFQASSLSWDDDTDSSIAEGVKWNAPSFRTHEYFATTHLRAKEGIALVLHLGAKVRDVTKVPIADLQNLLKWLAKDRALAAFRNDKDLEARTEALQAILRQWIVYV